MALQDKWKSLRPVGSVAADELSPRRLATLDEGEVLMIAT
jgi:hypothetical protein